jgi:putative ABC transport system ATP-binding protein
MLELDRVVKHYRGAGEEVRAIDGVSMTIQAGEMLAVHGPSGSGKTTLLLLIAALLRAEAGTIRYEQRDLASFSEADASDYLLRDVGFIYQDFHLMPRVSALENASVKLLLRGASVQEAQTRAQGWLERLGLGDRLRQTPDRLSGGERQRVAIAGVLAAEPSLILADEPSANLDRAGSRDVVELLHDVSREQGVGVLLVTHDTEAAAIADANLVLRDGKLLAGAAVGERALPIASSSRSAP